MEVLYRFIDRDLDDSTWRQVEIHIKECRPCWDRHDFEVRLKQKLQTSCQKDSCTENLRLRIRSILDRF
jgi:anti-sigma factor (TIGR02949 family)